MRSISEFIASYANAQQMGIDLDKILPLKETIRSMAEKHNLPVEFNEKSEAVAEAKAKLVDDLTRMMQ